MRFAVRVKPGTKRTLVGGTWDGPGGAALVVAVTAPAVDGKANAAVCAAVADAFGVRASTVRIVRGERGRDKLVELDPAPTGAREMLAQLREAALG